MIIGIDGNEANIKKRVGVGNFAYNVLKNIEVLDQKNTFYIYLKHPPLPDLPRERPGWQYQVFGPKRFWSQLALPFKLLTQKEKLTVFYSPSHYAPRFCPFPTVISIMDLWHYYHPEQFSRKDLFQLKNWERYSVLRAAKIIAISESTKKDILKFYNYSSERITVAYPGGEESAKNINIEIRKNKIREVKRKFGIKGEYLLYLGTLQPKKNLPGLLNAFKTISSFSRGISLVIAGKKGWLYEEIFQEVKRLHLEKKVIFTDFVGEEEKLDLILGCRCFVLPSFYEGFGIPVLEAMQLGVPVAISNLSSLPEVGGKAAFYFDPEEPKKIAETILKVLKLTTEQRERIIEAGKEQANKFSWEKCSKKIIGTLESFNSS